MALPFGVWDVSEAFNRAQDFEEEQEEQTLEEDQTEDDEFIVRFTPTIKQSLDSNDRNNSFLRISKLIITSDDVGAAFTDAYLLNQNCNQKIGLISGPFASSQRGNTVSQNHFWDKSCFLYTLSDKPDVIVCQMKQSLDEKFVFDWVDKVFNSIKPESVIVLTIVPKCNLQLEVSTDTGMDDLYQLQSDLYQAESSFPTLPRPNLIGKLPAGVLTYCQVHTIPAILYILATESLLFDVTAVKSFAPVLQEDIFNNVSKSSQSKLNEALKKLCEMNVPDKGVFI